MIIQTSYNRFFNVFLVLFLMACSSKLIAQHEINHLKLYGETVNKLSYIENFINVKEGDVVTMEELERTRTNLVQLPKYGHVHLKVDTLSQEKIDVTYELYEVKTAYPLVNLGAVEGNKFVQLGIGNSSAFGVGLVYNAFYRNTDNRHNFQIDAFKPFIKGLPIGFGAVISRDASVEPIFYEDQTGNFNYTKINGSAEFQYFFTPRNVLSLNAAYFEEDYEQIPQSDLDIEDFFHRKSLFSVEFRHDMRNYFYYYIQGGVIEAKLLQVINYDFDGNFNLAQVQYKGFKRVGERHNLAVRLQSGVATNSDSPFAPFVLDSYLNIRGSGNRQERGTAVVIGNFEWRWAFFEKKSIAAQAVAFADIGTWRTPGSEINRFTIKDEFRAFSGIGFRFIHREYRNAILRIDYGRSLYQTDTAGFVLGLGQYF